MLNNGLRLGKTVIANWLGESAVEIANTLGRIYGSRLMSFICKMWLLVFKLWKGEGVMTSSSSVGNIFRVRRLSENLSKTLISPFMNDIFSSLVFEVKFDRSKKLRVEIGREEKNGWDGRVAGVGLLVACRVIRERSRPEMLLKIRKYY
jgi:hypothetical protein